MIWKKKGLLLSFFLLSFLSYAQEKVRLRAFLETLETRFECKFSFKDADLTFHQIQPQEFDGLTAALAYLQDQTLFKFTPIQDNTIAISKKEGLITVCGQVVERVQNVNFPDVVVTSPYQQLLTDQGGRFTLQLNGANEVVSLQYTGYANLKFVGSELEKNPCQKIFLSRQIELLKPVTLSNYFVKGIFKNLDGSLTVNYNDFDILPGLVEPDVLLTVQALPGIQSVNEAVSYLNIRGGTNDQNLILWDGIKMYQNGHFFGLISAFNPQLTEELTLIKNGTTASLGDGVSGVLSMNGSSNINTQLRGGIGFNLINADAYVDIPLSAIGSIQVSARKSLNNLVKTPTYKSYFDRAFQNTEVTNSGETFSTSDDTFSFYDTSIRALFQPTEKDRFRANFLLLGNQLEFSENAIVDQEFQSLRSDLMQDNIAGGFYYQRFWTNDFQTDVQLYGSSYLLEATNYDILNDQRLVQQNKILESGLKVNGHLQLLNNLQAHFGYQLNETGVTNFEQINNPFFERTDKQVLVTNSAYAEAKFRPFEHTLLNAGLRVNLVSKFNEVLWEPRFSFSHQFLNYFSFEILGEFKSQTTSQIIDFQNDFLGVENRRWVLSKPNSIPILKSKQLSTGISMNRKGWLISVEPYLKKVTGITTQSQGFQNQFQNEKSHGDYTTYGIDFLVNKRFRKINSWLSYSYAKNDYYFESLNPQKFRNNLDIRHTFTCGIDYSLNQFNIAAGLNWHSGKPTTLLVPSEEVLDGELNFSYPNSATIPDYIRLDVSGTYQFQWGEKTKIFIGASLWNLVNRDNVINHFYRLQEDGEVEDVKELALQLTPNFTLRAYF
ncbi:MAG TPA: TonB-dependent receptor plug domain-containing protein [Flavobacteriaceae bacterium]|nr:TonB-dependent receptor plug domain-containing protein [Flavobacteriaceae bacterium]MCB9212965.1 TonB-dependent receptor plug domain-containing protein [Alteromonas sp.]HPF11363.1 TonB-dependent receptor plug domain-containing protein [Flavobacteriaceae bacterium]HQU20526.1 TonB-dependent receptor plug domain-containing protein [Flavobacteriaceae bacterium]HQU65841.1 TonB-dependent receptor plug domain-containing protein [Flavobacteriaceae bacterium]